MCVKTTIGPRAYDCVRATAMEVVRQAEMAACHLDANDPLERERLFVLGEAIAQFKRADDAVREAHHE